MILTLLNSPSSEDWAEVKRRALITMYGKGLRASYPEPDSEWKEAILLARHSPIRYLQFSYLIQDIPSNISTHLARHTHSVPYISSLRNDRQDAMDGDKAPRDTPVNMIYDVNAEELITIANKRLCNKASAKTREVVQEICNLAVKAVPELKSSLVPMCIRNGGICYEMFGCGKCPKYADKSHNDTTDSDK